MSRINHGAKNLILAIASLCAASFSHSAEPGRKPAAAPTAAPTSSATPSAPAASAPPARRSGREDMSPALQALQDDLSRNPGVLWIEEGRAHWRRPSGPPALSCQDCHGDPASKMADVATRYPAWDERDRRALTLNQRIEQCRSRHQNLLGPALDTDTGVALQSLLTDLARGKPITPPEDARMQGVREAGARLYRQRMGQLDLSCAQCHDERSGQRLGGSVIPQAHPNGYPLYRLQWQAMGSLHRRLRNCMGGVRAQSWDNSDPAWVALEAYLMQRAKGMPIESPAVRP